MKNLLLENCKIKFIGETKNYFSSVNEVIVKIENEKTSYNATLLKSEYNLILLLRECKKNIPKDIFKKIAEELEELKSESYNSNVEID